MPIRANHSIGILSISAPPASPLHLSPSLGRPLETNRLANISTHLHHGKAGVQFEGLIRPGRAVTPCQGRDGRPEDRAPHSPKADRRLAAPRMEHPHGETGETGGGGPARAAFAGPGQASRPGGNGRAPVGAAKLAEPAGRMGSVAFKPRRPGRATTGRCAGGVEFWSVAVLRRLWGERGSQGR